MDIGFWSNVVSIVIALKDFLLYIVEWLYSIFFKLSGKAFYFKDYAYKTTVYANGLAIITHSYTIKVLNMEKFKSEGINKMLDISDSCANNAKMPGFNKMSLLNKSERFSNYGFWQESTDNCMKVSQSKEGREDKEKVKKWTFVYNKRNGKDINKIKMSYAFSVPRCFSLDDGYLSTDFNGEDFCTCFEISNPTFNFRFEVMLDDSISIDERYSKSYIELDTHNSMKNIRPLHFNKDKNELGTESYKTLFYKRYSISKKFPKFNNRYVFKWRALNKGVDNI